VVLKAKNRTNMVVWRRYQYWYKYSHSQAATERFQSQVPSSKAKFQVQVGVLFSTNSTW
jgi:hypothetical protein